MKTLGILAIFISTSVFATAPCYYRDANGNKQTAQSGQTVNGGSYGCYKCVNGKWWPGNCDDAKLSAPNASFEGEITKPAIKEKTATKK